MKTTTEITIVLNQTE